MQRRSARTPPTADTGAGRQDIVRAPVPWNDDWNDDDAARVEPVAAPSSTELGPSGLSVLGADAVAGLILGGVGPVLLGPRVLNRLATTPHDVGADFTAENIANFKRQINALGFSYDWDREVNTTDPHYYKWTQWIFTKLYENGLAYEAEVSVNWVEELGTAIANEEVLPDGTSERGGYPVVRKPMRQWMLKITAYAERLLNDLEELDWPESIKDMQRNWIGKSTGANVTFKIKDSMKAR